jgi:hypothetical protein
MDKKRVIFIAIFSIAVIGIGYALYRVFFAPEAPPPEVVEPVVVPGEELPTAGETEGPEPGEAGPGTLPEVGVTPGVTAPGEGAPAVSEIISQPIEGLVVSPASDAAGGARFYSETDGKFYRLTASGSVAELSDEVFFNVSNVNWSPTQNESIIEYPDGSNIYYNFTTKKQVTLPRHWEDFSFSPEGDKIAAKSIGVSEDSQWLVSSDPTGNNVQLLEPMGANADKVIVDWSANTQVVALSRTGSTQGERQEVLLVGQYGENFKSVTVEGRGLETKWSPDGTKLLHSVYSARSDYKPELWVVNASGGSDTGSGRRLLNVNTWADKCDFADERFVYCAVPIALERGVAFAPELADTIRYDIYRIDTQTGASLVLPLDAFHVIDSVFVDEGGRTLYFTDVDQNGLFQIPI